MQTCQGLGMAGRCRARRRSDRTTRPWPRSAGEFCRLLPARRPNSGSRKTNGRRRRGHGRLLPNVSGSEAIITQQSRPHYFADVGQTPRRGELPGPPAPLRGEAATEISRGTTAILITAILIRTDDAGRRPGSVRGRPTSHRLGRPHFRIAQCNANRSS